MRKEEFLQRYKSFQLGDLPTEQLNEQTKGLSQLVQSDLNQAVSILKAVDERALDVLVSQSKRIGDLGEAIQATLSEGGKIFLCGCGATGRLSLFLEYLWRDQMQTDQVVAFMAGGDVALVHSLEGFEDYPELGARHLKQLQFSENDLLVSCTEGGETPFVIGATEEACQISKRKPWFLYCNPDDVLKNKVERSRKVIENDQIEKISLFVGPMALSGSTRMQASTVLQLAVGVGLLESESDPQDFFKTLKATLTSLDFTNLEKFIVRESEIYQNGDFLLYRPFDHAITVFTDTTERSPTFSLPAFENDQYQGDAPSLCYIEIPSAQDRHQAWNKLLLREPRPLNWLEIDKRTSEDYLQSFDFSQKAQAKRQARLGDKTQHFFEVRDDEAGLSFKLDELECSWTLSIESPLMRQTLLKIVLNIHSTLLMGRLQRYKSNMMTWVSATNGKLVDRATRYVMALMAEQGQDVDYLDVVDRIYKFQGDGNTRQCIVSKVLNSYQNM